MDPAAETKSPQRPTLKELAALFLRLGATSFGGPAAHIGLLQNEVVHRRGWVSSETFLDLLGATNLIPGPNSTEMAIHLGHKLRGWKGLIVAGVSFIVPAMTIVMALSWAYVRFGSIPALGGALYGIKPVMIAVVGQALWSLGRACLRTRVLLGFCVVDIVAMAVGFHELAILFGTGFGVALFETARRRITSRDVRSYSLTLALLPTALISTAADASLQTAFSMRLLFLTFMKIGAVLFGSGYVLLAYLNTDFVERLGWLTKQELLDAVTIGQITPGPLFTTATFVGYLMAGPLGGIVATVGIFLPSFVFVALSAPLVPHLRRSESTAAFLNGVNVASWVLMAAVTVDLATSSVLDLPTLALALGSLVALIRFRVNSTWLVLVGAVVGSTKAFWMT